MLRLINHKILFILVFISGTILFYLPLILTPGYYSHDELSIWRASINFGWAPFTNFSSAGFYRPLGWNMQILIMHFAGNIPQLVHLFNVLLHAVNGVLFYFILRRLTNSNNYKFPLISAVLFVISPLAAFAVGWTATLFDVSYMFFILIIILIMVSFKDVGEKSSWLNWKNFALFTGFFILTVLSLLCKESAIMAVVYIGITFIWFKSGKVRILALSSAALASGIYMLLRLQGILTMASGGESNPYGFNLGNIGGHLVSYLLYPFAFGVPEIHTIFASTVPSMLTILLGSVFKFIDADSLFRICSILWIALITFGAILHISIIIMFAIRHQFRWGIIYIIIFILTLVPVLALNKPVEGQYLYVSAIALSIALAYLLTNQKSKNEKVSEQISGVQTEDNKLRVMKGQKGNRNIGRNIFNGALIVMVAFLVIHTFVTQFYFHKTGIEQRNFLASLTSAVQTEVIENKVSEINIAIVCKPDSPYWMADRATHELESIGGIKINTIKVIHVNQNFDNADANIILLLQGNGTLQPVSTENLSNKFQ